ncbi:MAG: hypothetical protein GC153_12535 [Alphaproteobacteria bacterium]|nr:hypothetical protein [Alphaproteobacteria bacterium]
MADIDRRKYQRRALDLGVRFLSEGGTDETTGRIIDISEGGLAMSTDREAKLGDAIIAYPQGLGRLTGKVVRCFDGGIAIQFDLSESQRAYLKKRLDAAERGVPFIRLLERRAHDRLTLNLSSEAKLIGSGETFECAVLDISQAGAAIRADHRPRVGEAIEIGTLKGIVCRHTKDGFAIDFAALAQPRECA